MRKTLYVAQREFIATAGTRAFIVGILVTPIVIGVLIVVAIIVAISISSGGGG